MSKKQTRRRLWFVVAGLTLGLALFTLWQRNLLRHVIVEVSNTLWCDRRCDHKLVHSTLSVQLAWQFQGNQMLDGLPSIGNDGTIYFASGQMIYALDPEMGRTKWEKWLGPWSGQHLIVPYADKVLLTQRNNSVLLSVRASDGSLVWEAALKDFVLAHVGDPLVIQVLYDSERLYVVVSLRRGTQVLAFDSSTGQVLWKAPAALAERMGVPHAAFLDKEHIIVLQPDIVTLDKNTGQILMQKDISLHSSRPPVYAQGTLYDSGKFIRAIDAASVQERWRFDSECLPPFHELQPPVVDDGIVYIPSTCQYLYAVDANSGQVKWRYETPEGAVKSFVVFKGLGYLVSEDARLHAIDLVTGVELGQAQFRPALMPLEVGPGIVAYDNLLLLQLGDRLLFAFR